MNVEGDSDLSDSIKDIESRDEDIDLSEMPSDVVKVDSESVDGVMANKIRKDMDSNDFEGVYVYGKRRIGKNAYIFKTMYNLVNDWDRVFKYSFFDPKSLCDFVESCLRNNVKVPCILFDDVGVHANSSLYHDDTDTYRRLQGVVDTIGVVTYSIFMTSPIPGKGLDFLLDSNDWIIKVTKRDSMNERRARIYELNHYPSGKITNPFRAYDDFNKMLDDYFYKKLYFPKRKQLLADAISNVRGDNDSED